MKRTFLMVTILAAMLTSTERAFAWGRVGHTTIGYAAEQFLTPEAKEKCHHYLRSTLAFNASLMDDLRSIEEYAICDKWHSSNVDKNGKCIEDREGTAAYQIERIRKEMKDYKNLPDSLVRINLVYLIHMVGDAHCPVHIRWNKQERPEYFYSLKTNGKKRSYHGFWDGSVNLGRRWTAERYFEEFPRIAPKKVAKLVKGTAYQWTTETAGVAKRCFKLTPADTEVGVKRIDQYTLEEVHRIADMQCIVAAYRLAAVLNDIFKE